MTKTFASIVITGASSGIGEALALDYAAPGIALALSGRDSARLQAVAEACRAKGATVDAGQIDVVDKEALAAWLTRFDDAHPVDLLIANAGISIDKDNSSIDDFSIIRQTMAVNVDGVFNTVEPLLGAHDRARTRPDRRGVVAGGLHRPALLGLLQCQQGGRPGVGREPALCAEEERHRRQRDLPGFVVSRLTASAPFPMPFLMSAARASAIIRGGLARNKARIAFPIGTKAAVWLGTGPAGPLDRAAAGA